MHDEYKKRAARHGLSYETWTTHSDPSTCPQIVLVSVEASVLDALNVYVMTLIRLGRLARIAVDEAHLLIQHSSFRPCLDMVERLGRMPVSMVLMTATCPRHLERKLFEKVGRQVYQVLRQATDRPEIAQKIIPVTSIDFENVVAEKISSLTQNLSGSDRALLFCWSRDECDRMAALLKWRTYHSSVSLDDRSENKELWLRGEVMGLVCTSMLNCCLDYPSVRYVFHLGAPRDATDYYQAIGRCARDGKPGHAVVYFHSKNLPKFTGDDLFGATVIYELLHDDTMCRRLRPGIFFDGVAAPCAMLPGAQLCDICEGQLNQVPPETGPIRFPSHLLQNLESPGSSGEVIENDDHDHRQDSSRASTSNPSRFITPLKRVKTLAANPNNPINHPAPSASFGGHFSAAQSSIKQLSVRPSDERLRQIHVACQILAKCCIYCWSQGFDYNSHSLPDCLFYASERCPAWKVWHRQLKFPAGCCFFCGCPMKVRSFCSNLFL
jgi:hypothetical protein